MMKKIRFLTLGILLLGLAGCAKVTPISKEITMELGQGLSEDPAQFVNVDASQNAVVYTLPVYVDGTASVLEQTEVVLKNMEEIFAPDFTGFSCVDNLNGDITDSEYTEISLEELVISKNGIDGFCKFYITSTDRAGNTSEAHWETTLKNEVNFGTALNNTAVTGFLP